MAREKPAYIDINKMMKEGKTVLVHLTGATAKGESKLLKSLILEQIKESGDGQIIVDEFQG